MKLENYSNASFLQNLRYQLISLIAGRTVVMLNAKISIIDQHIGSQLVVNNVKGGFFQNCTFPTTDGQILSIEQRGASK